MFLTIYAARKYKQHQAEKRQLAAFTNLTLSNTASASQPTASALQPGFKARPGCTGACGQSLCSITCSADCWHQRQCLKKCQKISGCERKQQIRQANAMAQSEVLGMSVAQYEALGCCERKKLMRQAAANAGFGATYQPRCGRRGGCGRRQRGQLVVGVPQGRVNMPVANRGVEVAEHKEANINEKEFKENAGDWEEVEEEGIDGKVTGFVEPPAYEHKY